MKSYQQMQSQYKTNKCISIIVKPLRIFQFLVILMLFAFVVYMIAMDPTPISALACILLIVLSGVYVFVLAIELIRQFSGGTLYIIPMFVFSLIGIPFFGTIGISLICTAPMKFMAEIMAITLCLLTAFIFLIDIAMVLAFWKRRCSACKRCCNNDATDVLFPKVQNKDKNTETEKLYLSHVEIKEHDATTSVSDIRLPLIAEENAIPDHSYRKIEHPRRRQYVDCPTCVPSLHKLGIAEIQTEPKIVSMMESQTPQKVMKETPMQTLSKCEFCHRNMQTLAENTTPFMSYSENPPQWTCPAIVQFVRGKIGVPCCPGCKCATEAMQTQKQQQQQQQQTSEHQKGLSQTPKKTDESLTSEAARQVTSPVNAASNSTAKSTGVTETVTKITLVSNVKPNKKTQIVPNDRTNNLAHKQKIDAKKVDVKQGKEMQNVDQELTKGTVAKTAREEPGIINETIVEPTVETVTEKSLTILEKLPVLENFAKEGNKQLKDKKSTVKEEALVEKLEYNKIERNKGGGEKINVFHQSAHMAQQENTKNEQESPRNTFATQISATLTPLISSRSKNILHFKSNKVDPVDDTSISDENRISRKAERETLRTTYVNQAAQGDELSESSNPAEDQMKDGCSYCERQKSLTPTSYNCRYYIIFKDKKGKYFCEFCAPIDSKKVVNRNEIAELKRLRCTNCRLSFRGRSVGTNIPKVNICPKCGQSQRLMASFST